MLGRQLAIFAAIGVTLVSALNCVFIVDQRDRVALFQVGEIQGTDFAPGLHFKWPYWQNVRTFDGRVLTVDNQTENFLTHEKKNVKADFFIKWKIADTAKYYRATGGDESFTADRLIALVDSGLRDAFGARTIQEVVASGDAMTATLGKVAQDKAADLGVDIVDVRIKRLELPDDVLKAWHDRMSAEREGQAQALRAKGAEEAEKVRAEADQKAQAIQSEAYALAERTRGEGDARAAEIYARAYGQDPEFFRFWRSLAAYREALHDPKDVLVLEPDSEFFRYFKNANPAGK
jgi:membrane protease subunit HflC